MAPRRQRRASSPHHLEGAEGPEASEAVMKSRNWSSVSPAALIWATALREKGRPAAEQKETKTSGVESGGGHTAFVG